MGILIRSGPHTPSRVFKFIYLCNASDTGVAILGIYFIIIITVGLLQLAYEPT